MLASTVQFSTSNQTPATRPRQTQPARRRHRWYEEQTGPDEITVTRSLRTQQRAYDHPPPPIPFPTTASKDTGTY